MIIDWIDFRNTLRTLGGVDAAAGLFEDAYGAALSLIHWQELTPQGRQAWLQAVTFGDGTKPYFFHYLNQLRLEAYGPSFYSIGSIRNLLPYPWSLADADFQYCMLYIRTGHAPDPEDFEKHYLSKLARQAVQAGEDAVKKKILDYLEKIAAAAGGTGVRFFIKVKNAGPAGAVLGLGLDYLNDLLKEMEKKNLIDRYNIDEERRLYLASQGQSTYQKVIAAR